MDETPRRAAPDTLSVTRRRLERLATASRLALAWERLWPRLWTPLAVLLTFLAVSWFGLWQHLPWWGRAVGVGLFALAILASLVPALRSGAPSRREALARLDRSSLGAHRPATALDDSLAVGQRDPVSQALWALHVKRQSEAVSRLRVDAPHPRMALHDRRALRLLPVLAAVAAFFVAGHAAVPRLLSAFDWRGPAAAGAPVRIDAWIDPPAHTRLPPILIDFARLPGTQFSVPKNSTVVVRIAGESGMDVATTGGLDPIAAEDAARDATKDSAKAPAAGSKPAPAPAARTAAAPSAGVLDKRFTVSGDATLRITGRGAPEQVLSLTAVIDQPPEIALVGEPESVSGLQGGLAVTYRARDDYGIAGIEAVISREEGAAGRSLVEPPTQSLPVPASGEEEMRRVLDVTSHPWAGARVGLTLVARDEIGQEGRSQTLTVTLPQRVFSKPLAKALVEQRRILAMDADARRTVQLAMDALMIEPQLFMKETGVYLGMRMVSERLRRAASDDQLREVVELMWALAIELEDGALSDAEKALRAAQENLRQALERGASDEEIRKLTEEMRRAMDRYMRDLAQQMQKRMQEGGQEQAQTPENFRSVTPRDLQNMLDRIEELSRRGETAEAQRLMEELNNLLNNLQMARPGQQDQRQREMNQTLGDLDRMAREQQDLRDETFRQEQRRQDGMQQQRGRPQARPGQRQQGQQGQQQGQRGRPQPGEQGEAGEGQSGEGLSQRQQALRERLEELQRRMRGMGADPGELAEAEEAMREAERQLGQGQGGEALDAQGRALEALRRGGDNLAQQMQGQPGEGEGQGNAYGEPDGRPPGRPSAQQRGSDDPLGRPQRQRDWADGRVRVPGADESATQRARRILEELRRRLGDPARPLQELDYLERLLRRN